MAIRTPRRRFTATSCTCRTSAKSILARCSSPANRAASPWCASSWAATMAGKSPPRKGRATVGAGLPFSSMRFLLAGILFLYGCGLRPAERLDALFEAASDDFHAGELAKAQLAAEHGIAVAASRGDLVYQAKFRLLRCDILLNSRRAEEVLNQLHDPLPPAPEFAALAARKTAMEARAISMLGRVDEGGARLDAAHRAAEAAKAEDVLLEIETIQGLRLIRRHHYEYSEVALRAALARARTVHAAYSEAAVQVNLGLSRLQRLRWDEAIPYFEKAAALAGPQSRTLYSLARSNLAICYSQLEIGR